MPIRVPITFLIAILAAGCGGGSSPTSPSGGSGGSGSSSPTRIINVTGNLAFGTVEAGTSREAIITISNTGNSTLTVTGLSFSGELGPVLLASWTRGTIAAGGSQSVTVLFRPTAAGGHSSTLTVSGDQTSGTSSIGMSADALQSFTGGWEGGYVITQCNGTGSAQDLFCDSQRGSRRVGQSHLVSLDVTQTGNQISGNANLFGAVGPVTGTVVNGVLTTLTGTVRDSQGQTAVITAFNATVTGKVMSGGVSYSMTFTGAAGTVGIVATLNISRVGPPR